MAYMSQERKTKLAANLKALGLKGWKFSLRVRHHSTIVMTVTAAPVDVIGIANASTAYKNRGRDNAGRMCTDTVDVNPYWMDDQFSQDPTFLATMRDVLNALNDGNHDRSDIMTDYFDVGWYVDIKFGSWDKPFLNTKA